jgi:hypothetical protein
MTAQMGHYEIEPTVWLKFFDWRSVQLHLGLNQDFSSDCMHARGGFQCFNMRANVRQSFGEMTCAASDVQNTVRLVFFNALTEIRHEDVAER